MASIATYLQKIIDAVYGEEVRGSIRDALAAMNVESSNAMAYASTAQDSAQASAAKAEEHETRANQRASEAAASAGAAKTSESNAKASEVAALQKVTETAAAATIATEAKDGAQAAKTAAESAKAAAETAQSAAEDAKTAAETAKEDAVDSAASAANSAATAQQYSGKPPKPQDGTWWIWNAAGSKYEDTGISCELAGPQGVGVQDIVLTSGDHTPGTSDVYTIQLTDGTSKTISVYNGRNGTGAGDVLGVAFDLVLPANGWVDGVLTVSDANLLASAKYKYLLGAYETSIEEYLDCGIQPKDVTTNGAIAFTSQEDPTTDLTVNVIRLELGVNGV